MLDGMSVSTAVRDQMPNDHVAAVVLAAGKGTRMKSILPKVLHPLAGRPMILHLLDTVHNVGVERAVVVVGPVGRSEERRVGKEWGSTCRTRGARKNYKKKEI